MVKHVEREFAGRVLKLEAGRLAKQAAGSCLLQFGETVVLATVTVSDSVSTLPFFPLTVEYREKSYAAGKIPGGFLKREGRPSDEEILSARVTDRSVRPLFPEGFKNEIQVFIYVLSADQENDADVLGVTAASAALTMSKVPWNGPIAAVRVGRVEGAWILNPTFQQLEFSDVDMVVSGGKDSIVMVEGGALELTEAEIVKGLEVAQKGIRELLDAAGELVAEMQQPKMEWTKVEPPAGLVARVKQLAEARVSEALNLPEKSERAQALAALKATIQEQLAAEFPENTKDVANVIEDIEYRTMREQVLTHRERVDARELDTVRPISASTPSTWRRKRRSRSCCTPTSRRFPPVRSGRSGAPRAARWGTARSPSGRCRPCCRRTSSSPTPSASCPTSSNRTARRPWQQCAAARWRCSTRACR